MRTAGLHPHPPCPPRAQVHWHTRTHARARTHARTHAQIGLLGWLLYRVFIREVGEETDEMRRRRINDAHNQMLKRGANGGKAGGKRLSFTRVGIPIGRQRVPPPPG